MAKKAPDLAPAEILIFPFQDQAWIKKILVASALVLFSFIPVIPLVLLLGYLAQIIRGIALDGKSPKLPEWSNLSESFNQGLRLFGVGALYLLPAFVLFSIGYLAMFVPLLLVESGAMTELEGAGLILSGYIAAFGLMGVGALISLLTGLILPVAATHTAVKGDFTAAFHFKELWTIFRSNWGEFVVAYLVLIGAAVVLYYGVYFLAATVILCCFYPFAFSFLTAYLILIGGGLFGSAYRKAAQA